MPIYFVATFQNPVFLNIIYMFELDDIPKFALIYEILGKLSNEIILLTWRRFL